MPKVGFKNLYASMNSEGTGQELASTMLSSRSVALHVKYDRMSKRIDMAGVSLLPMTSVFRLGLIHRNSLLFALGWASRAFLLLG